MRLENDRYTENEIKKMPSWAEWLWQTAPKQLDLRQHFGSKNYDGGNIGRRMRTTKKETKKIMGKNELRATNGPGAKARDELAKSR